MIFKNFLTFWVNSDLIQTRFWEKVRIQTKPEKSDQFGHTAVFLSFQYTITAKNPAIKLEGR